MSASLYRTYKAWRSQAATKKGAKAPEAISPVQSSVCHALVLLGMGIEGLSCGNDVTPRGRH